MINFTADSQNYVTVVMQGNMYQMHSLRILPGIDNINHLLSKDGQLQEFNFFHIISPCTPCSYAVVIKPFALSIHEG